MDMDTLRFLAAPFAASLILTGIHSYLGVHVVERGVIFVDLSLAQIAALGASIAILLPFTEGDPHGPGVYWVSLFFTFIGAAVFSTIRVRRARIPQEAIIGICYAVASASILAMSKHVEIEHLNDISSDILESWDRSSTPHAIRRDRRFPSLRQSSRHLQWTTRPAEARASPCVLGLPLLCVVRVVGLVGATRGSRVCYLSASVGDVYADPSAPPRPRWTWAVVSLPIYLSRARPATARLVALRLAIVMAAVRRIRPTVPAPPRPVGSATR